MDHFELKNSQVFVLVEAAGGVYSSDALATVCKIAESHSAFLKITEDQRVGFMISPEAYDEIAAALQASGLLLRSYQRKGTPSPKACLGELCPHAEQDALGDALDLHAALQSQPYADKPFVTLGVNGCARACVGSGLDDIHIVGEESGYKISLGGKAREIPALGQFVTDNVPREKLPEVVSALLDIFYAHVDQDERVVDVVERMGLSAFADAADRILHGEGTVPDEGADLPLEGADVPIEGDEASLASAELSQEEEPGEPLIEEDILTTEEGDLLTAEDGDSDAVDFDPPKLSADRPVKQEDSPAFDDVPLEDLDEGPAAEDIPPEVEELALAELGREEPDLPEAARAAEPTEIAEFEEEVDLDDIPQEARPSVSPGPQESSEDLLEEGGLDIEDASADDLARVTNAIRAEVADENSELAAASPTAPTAVPTAAPRTAVHGPTGGLKEASTDVNSEILAFEKTRGLNPAPDAKRQPPSGPSSLGAAPQGQSPGTRSPEGASSLSVRMEHGNVAIAMPGGFHFRCSLDSLPASHGPLFELQTEQGLLQVVATEEGLTVRLGAMEMTLPLAESRAA